MERDKFVNAIRYKTDISKLYYPVGNNIIQNLPSIDKLAECFIQVCETHKLVNKHINLFCTGSSGVIVATIIAQKLREKDLSFMLIHIKKDGENSHSAQVPLYSGYTFENSLNVFVDDFIASGETIDNLTSIVKTKFPQFVINMICVTGNVNGVIVEKFKPKYIIQS